MTANESSRKWFAVLRGVLTLDDATYIRLRDSKNAMRVGVLVLLVAFLIAGSLQFVFDLVEFTQPFRAEEAAEVRAEVARGIEQALAFTPQTDAFTRAFLDEFMRNFDSGLNIAVEVSQLPTTLPKFAGGFLQALGQWLSNPFAHLGAWLAYAIWVLLFARLLGGNGGVDRFLGLTALYAVPNALGIFSPIPYVGGLIALVGTVWGWIVYIKAVQISQRFDLGKAILAAVLPLLALVVIAILAVLLLIVSIAIAASN